MFCGKASSDKLEKLNERALRIVYKDTISSYDDLLTRSRLLSLKKIRLKYMIIEVFKCVHDINPTYMNSMFSIKEPKYDFRDGSVAHQPKWETKTFGYRSFTYYGSKLWNSLPPELKIFKPDDFFAFKTNLTEWLLTTDTTELEIS